MLMIPASPHRSHLQPPNPTSAVCASAAGRCQRAVPPVICTMHPLPVLLITIMERENEHAFVCTTLYQTMAAFRTDTLYMFSLP